MEKAVTVNIYIYLTHDSCAQTDDLCTGYLISQPMLGRLQPPVTLIRISGRGWMIGSILFIMLIVFISPFINASLMLKKAIKEALVLLSLVIGELE